MDTKTFTPLPAHMKNLPTDERGYVIPWFVDYVDGKPEFRAMDMKKYKRAIQEKLCWVCGQRIPARLCFVAGPMCGVNRISSEPPSHVDCGRWSAINCPFLSNPRMVRREDELINNASFAEKSAGTALSRNPGVTMLWITRGYEIIRDPRNGGVLLMMGTPEATEWYREGRTATRSEVQTAIDEGLIYLRAAAKTEPGGMDDLNFNLQMFKRLMPKE